MRDSLSPYCPRAQPQWFGDPSPTHYTFGPCLPFLGISATTTCTAFERGHESLPAFLFTSPKNKRKRTDQENQWHEESPSLLLVFKLGRAAVVISTPPPQSTATQNIWNERSEVCVPFVTMLHFPALKLRVSTVAFRRPSSLSVARGLHADERPCFFRPRN